MKRWNRMASMFPEGVHLVSASEGSFSGEVSLEQDFLSEAICPNH